MRLLFDQNLSPRLVERLEDLYPNSVHVLSVGLSKAMDVVVWDYALQNGLTIVTKDADFSELGTMLGFPPPVVWIRRGNCSTQEIETILRDHYDAIEKLYEDSEMGILTLF